MKREATKQMLTAAVVLALAGALGGGPVQALTLPPSDHLLVKGDDMDKVTSQGDYFYGVIGGNAYLDSGTLGTMDKLNTALQNDSKITIGGAGDKVKPYAAKFDQINQTVKDKTTAASGTVTITEGKTTTFSNGGKDWTRYYGLVGGDASINLGLKGELKVLNWGHGKTNIIEQSQDTEIIRKGDVNNTLADGSAIVASGGSTAIALGNINAKVDYKYPYTLGKLTFKLDIADGDVDLAGKTSITIDGNVKTTAEQQANLVGFINGGIAAGIGGEAKTTVTGNTELSIVGTDRIAKDTGFESPDKDAIHQLTTGLNIMKGSNINAFGITGGGAAVTTFGGTATSEVKGTSTVTVQDGTVVAAFGGGGAVAADATGVYNTLMKPKYPVGNNDGTVDIDGEQLGKFLGKNLSKDDVTITVKDAVQGGTATTTTGDTVVNLNGASSGLGVFGGGAAIATHSYTWRANNVESDTNDTYKIGDEFGTSKAIATTGKATINVNLKTTSEGGLTDEEKGKMIQALKNAKNQIGPNASASYDVLRDFSGKGTAVGLFGGGMAIAHSTSGQNTDAGMLLKEAGSFATASTAGAEMNLNSGYAVGVFGGGIAATMGNASAKAEMTDTVDINIGEKMETVGVFGSGIAAFTGSSNSGQNNLVGMATVTSTNTNINIAGKADGVFGGGLVIDDSQADKVNALATMTGKTTVNVGQTAVIDTVNFGAVGTGNTGTGAPSLSDYPKGAKEATKTVAIAGGGVVLGGGAQSSVKEAEINIAGTVTGDILGGGAAAYGYDGESKGSVVDTSVINLIGGKVTGNVYAGGSVATAGTYTGAKATVGTGTINLAGTEVTGILSGGGLKDGSASWDESVKANTSTLNLVGNNTLSLVNGASKIQGFTQTTAKAGSVTKLENIAANNTNAVIDVKGGKVTVEAGASLDIRNLATADKPYYVAGNYAAGSTFWNNESLLYDRFTSYAQQQDKDGKYTISFEKLTTDNVDRAAKEMAGRMGGRWVHPLVAEKMLNGAGEHIGASPYFSDWNEKADTSSESFDRGGLIGEDTAVTGHSVSLASDMADNIMQRLSFTEAYIGSPGWVNEAGGIWAKYIHKKYETNGLSSTVGGLYSNTDYDGAILGMDFAKKGTFQSGLAFHYGTGEGTGLLSSNDYDAWGVTLYGGWKKEAAHTNVMTDLGYTKTANDITGQVNGKSLTTDRDVDIWTFGVRGEKEYISGTTQVVPHVGLRYLHVAPSRYTSYYDGQKAFEYDAENQNLWLLPIGVSVRNETVTNSGWRITPKVDLAYIWSFGDTDTTTDVWMNNGVSSLSYTVMDDSWLASLGIEATKDAWSYGLGYAYQKGDDTKTTKWYANASYAF